jgi:MoaA/NifB/PqqE/SkfB family radical SAM enzyme
MPRINGTQLYGLNRWAAMLRMSRHKALKGLSLKQKLALHYVSRESKLTRLGSKIYSNTFTPYFPSKAYDRFLEGIVAVSKGSPVPVVANLAVTTACPCKCWHCSFAKRGSQHTMSLATIQNTIADIQNLGASVVGITGGEPLLRKDLEEMIAAIDDRAIALLFTTGYHLTRSRVKRLRRAGLEIPVISLDHYRADRHDRGRNRPGMFDHAVNAVRLFREEGFYTAVSFVPDRKLMNDRDALMRTIAFFRELGINDMRLTSPILSGLLAGHPEVLLTPENVRTIIDIQKKCTSTPGHPGVFAYDFFESDRYYGCGAGYNYLFIDAQGNVCPCDFTMLSFGNIHKKPLAASWRKMSEIFSRPGCKCYANASSEQIAKLKPARWPLGTSVSEEITQFCPTHERDRLPEFYRRMGLSPKNRVAAK